MLFFAWSWRNSPFLGFSFSFCRMKILTSGALGGTENSVSTGVGVSGSGSLPSRGKPCPVGPSQGSTAGFTQGPREEPRRKGGTKEEGRNQGGREYRLSESGDIWLGDFGSISVALHVTPGLLSHPVGPGGVSLWPGFLPEHVTRWPRGVTNSELPQGCDSRPGWKRASEGGGWSQLLLGPSK